MMAISYLEEDHPPPVLLLSKAAARSMPESYPVKFTSSRAADLSTFEFDPDYLNGEGYYDESMKTALDSIGLGKLINGWRNSCIDLCLAFSMLYAIVWVDSPFVCLKIKKSSKIYVYFLFRSFPILCQTSKPVMIVVQNIANPTYPP